MNIVLDINFTKKIFKFELGDSVRIARSADWKTAGKQSFAKPSVEGSYTKQLYTVASRQLRAAAARTPGSKNKMVPVYRLKEMEPHGCIFYEQEMQLVQRAPKASSSSSK